MRVKAEWHTKNRFEYRKGMDNTVQVSCSCAHSPAIRGGKNKPSNSVRDFCPCLIDFLTCFFLNSLFLWILTIDLIFQTGENKGWSGPKAGFPESTNNSKFLLLTLLVFIGGSVTSRSLVIYWICLDSRCHIWCYRGTRTCGICFRGIAGRHRHSYS